ncbi:MAP domain-containing protein [Staphylococcus schweitzeri]|uniref:MAP domain-containing protein n=1 Tax=Staphylococcus schweitzeri TaxID=1654388 RepID=UPI00050260D4|nr:MAP domain-containing protein [Staphylococcus schweitzeri]CDR67426.1 MHC class II antigen-like protein [Staphylococcus schweitzeri]
MKFKSLITTTVAIGILASSGVNLNQGHANTAYKVPTSSHHSNINDNYNIFYNIDVDGTSLYKLSSFSFSKKEPKIGYSKLTKRVKEALKHDRGINENKLSNVHKATYTVHFKNGTKRVINLKSNIFSADLINIYDIKEIDINVKTKNVIKEKVSYVPYTISVDGIINNALTDFKFSNKSKLSYDDLTQRIKETLKHDRGINENKLRNAYKATYTVYFKNGSKKVVNLNSNLYIGELINSKNIKKIDINVKNGPKAKTESYVPYTIAVNGTSTPILSELRFTGDPRVSYLDVTKKVKSVLKHDRGVGERELKYAKKAKYTVYLKNGKKQEINLNSNINQLNLLYVKDIKKIEIDVKTGSKAEAYSYVPYTIAVNGTSTPILSKLKISNKQLISYQDLNKIVKSVLKNDRGINDIELKFAKKAKYTVHFKNGKKQVVDLKSNIFTRNLFSTKDIKKIDINVKKHVESNKDHNKVTKVKFPVTINDDKSAIKSPFVFSNGNNITLNDLSIKLKSALANEEFIKSFDLNISEHAKYRVYFKDGSSEYVDLKSNAQHSKVFKATDIKRVNIELKF